MLECNRCAISIEKYMHIRIYFKILTFKSVQSIYHHHGYTKNVQLERAERRSSSSTAEQFR